MAVILFTLLELTQYTKKSIEAVDINIFDINKPFNEIAASIKNIEKASKKSNIQLEAYIEKLKQENQELHDELINLRLDKRKTNQMLERTIKTLIFVIDQIDVMHKFALTTQDESWITSINNTLEIITKSINEIGLVEIPSLGEIFNEKVHNCIKAVKCSEKRQYEIVEVLRKGYRLNGEVIRPADVIAVE